MSTTMKVVGGLAVVIAVVIAPGLVVRPETAHGTTDTSHSIQAQRETPAALAEILNRSCGDCHSDAMVPRWYTKVPPFSAIMARAQNEGRKAVDFSRWTDYSPEQRHTILLASCDDAKRGTMPVGAYVRVRSAAKLSQRDIETICSAAEQEVRPATTAAGRQP